MTTHEGSASPKRPLPTVSPPPPFFEDAFFLKNIAPPAGPSGSHPEPALARAATFVTTSLRSHWRISRVGRTRVNAASSISFFRPNDARTAIRRGGRPEAAAFAFAAEDSDAPPTSPRSGTASSAATHAASTVPDANSASTRPPQRSRTTAATRSAYRSRRASKGSSPGGGFTDPSTVNARTRDDEESASIALLRLATSAGSPLSPRPISPPPSGRFLAVATIRTPGTIASPREGPAGPVSATTTTRSLRSVNRVVGSLLTPFEATSAAPRTSAASPGWRSRSNPSANAASAKSAGEEETEAAEAASSASASSSVKSSFARSSGSSIRFTARFASRIARSSTDVSSPYASTISPSGAAHRSTTARAILCASWNASHASILETPSSARSRSAAPTRSAARTSAHVPPPPHAASWSATHSAASASAGCGVAPPSASSCAARSLTSSPDAVPVASPSASAYPCAADPGETSDANAARGGWGAGGSDALCPSRIVAHAPRSRCALNRGPMPRRVRADAAVAWSAAAIPTDSRGS